MPIPNRPAAQAMQVITMHALGDVPSPPIVGAIQGAPACQAALVFLHGGVLRPCSADRGSAACIALSCNAVSAAVFTTSGRAGAMGKWRLSMTIMASTLAISVGIYAVGLWFCRSAPDYRAELLRQPLTAREARPGCGPAPAAGTVQCMQGAGRELFCGCRAQLQLLWRA